DTAHHLDCRSFWTQWSPPMLRFLSGLVLLLSVTAARAELVALEILKREPFADGKKFGDVGAYEKIIGIARFALDPAHKRNAGIVDLDKAPRNKDGKVEFEADV